MITKKSFIAILNAIRTQSEQDYKSGNLLTLLSDPAEQNYKVMFSTPIITELIKILVDEMKCETSDQIGNDIDYWIYEAKYGEHFDKIWKEDGSEVSIKTASDLYDWLLANIKE